VPSIVKATASFRILGLLSLLFVGGCASHPQIQTVPSVDIPRFMGDWYVIGYIPWIAEKGNVNTMDIYSLRPDGKIDVTYAFRKGSLDAPRQKWKAKAWVYNKDTRAHWKVQFIWPFSSDFLILDLAPDYRYTVVGEPTKKLAWIMSRTPQMSEADYQAILRHLAALGYDTSKFEKVPQPTKG